MTASTNEEHASMVQDCINRESKLTNWERQFIDSIGINLARGYSLTPMQVEKLDSIWERVT